MNVSWVANWFLRRVGYVRIVLCGRVESAELPDLPHQRVNNRPRLRLVELSEPVNLVYHDEGLLLLLGAKPASQRTPYLPQSNFGVERLSALVEMREVENGVRGEVYAEGTLPDD